MVLDCCNKAMYLSTLVGGRAACGLAKKGPPNSLGVFLGWFVMEHVLPRQLNPAECNYSAGFFHWAHGNFGPRSFN